jgi:alpha,alpha-trehalase
MRALTVRCRNAIAVLIGLWLPSLSFSVTSSQPEPQPPSVEFADLYRAVEMGGVFSDQKNFADAIPRQAPPKILAEYKKEKQLSGFSLGKFVARNFSQPLRLEPNVGRKTDEDVRAYIAHTWTVLERRPDVAETYSTLLPLSQPYIVPGGRFSEIYYWDSYFTMSGLEQDGRHDLARNMLENIASLIRRYGHMPNGNRSYYLSRSQPPFFAAMVDLIAAHDGAEAYRTHLPELQTEYNYWMDGAVGLAPGSAHRRVLRLTDGTVLNRYWDDRAVPRDESYREDVQTAQHADRPAAEVYRNLRAGAETGWDFSSRWLGDGSHLWTIRTTAIAPVDLNCLMLHLEQVLARAYAQTGDTPRAGLYRAKAKARSDAIRRLMWNADAGLFTDYLWQAQRQSLEFSAATVFPLYFGAATPEQAHAVATTLRRQFLEPGGLATTLTINGQQWDRPNGWAPSNISRLRG